MMNIEHAHLFLHDFPHEIGATALPTAAELGDMQAAGGLIGFRPSSCDGAVQVARLDRHTQGGGGVGGGKGLREHDAQEAVFFRRDDGQRAIVMAEDIRQVEGQFRPCLDRIDVIREHPELHDILPTAGPVEGRDGWRLLQPCRRLSRGMGPHSSPVPALTGAGGRGPGVAR